MPAIGAPFGDIKTSGGIMGHLDAILWHLQYGTLAYVGFDVLPPFVTWSVRYEDDAQRQQYLSALSERHSFPRFGLGKFARRFPADPQTIAFRICCSGLLLEDLLRPDVLLADRLNDQPLGIEHGAPLRLVAPAHYGYKNVKHLVAIEFWRDRRAYRFPSPYPALMDHPRAWRSRAMKPVGKRFFGGPSARVAFAERGRGIPGSVLRRFYRLIVPFTVWNFARALAAHRASPRGRAST